MRYYAPDKKSVFTGPEGSSPIEIGHRPASVVLRKIGPHHAGVILLKLNLSACLIFLTL
jgi:hypothetical protein